jgi:L-alanine-DL-glutamate epimerase-like enolase superfamily enzyme
VEEAEGEGMKITAIETLYLREVGPPFIFVLVHTDAGLTGLGQTADFRTAPVVHDLAQRCLVGQNPLHIESLWATMFDAAGFHGYSGAELRAISAIDIALWDILGQATGQPIYTLLGGPCRDRIRIYNTCSAYRERSDRELAKRDPVRLAGELLEQGITCMKWAMFDDYARASRGQAITAAQIKEGMAGIEAVADAFNGEMEVMVEGHGLWNVTSAVAIAQALEGLPVHWLEDMLWQDNPEAWADLRARTGLRIAGSERLYTRHQMRRLLELRGTDVMIGDITWTGGVSELKKMATMAEVYAIPLAPHDHSGPVNLWASAHVLLNVPNGYIMETTRVFYESYYDELVEGEPIIREGHLHLPQGPGLGIRLRPAVRERPDAVIERSELT